MSGTLPCRADTQCRPRFGDIWQCRRHVADMSATCGAKSFTMDVLILLLMIGVIRFGYSTLVLYLYHER